jgi:S-adenosylmethionine decarboxylase
LRSLGRHLMVELYNCDSKILNDVHKVETIMVDAAKHAHARIVDVVFHTFNPHGISGVIVIAESHLAIHTWPEYGYASIDIYTCGTEINPWRAYNYMVRKFKAKSMTAVEMKRGMLPIPARLLKHKPA